MKKNLMSTLVALFCIAMHVQAQLSPQNAIKAMARGINMGNTLEPPNEGDWGNTASAANFDDYKNAGFTCVRIPITWDKHSDTTAPYAINPTWLNRIEQVVDWGLSRHLIIIINAHHDGWIKDAYTDNHKARFDSIWSQIATRFKDKSDSLLFEVINEPNPLSLANVNDLNARIIQIMRKTNPTRIVLFSGNSYSNSAELIAAAIPLDTLLIGYYHSYDPYPFGLNGTGTYGTDADIKTTTQKFDQVTAWGTAHNIPVVLSEFGYNILCDYNSRMCAYATVVDQALAHNVAFNVWEDGGSFQFYNRSAHTWTEVKDILINTYKESPNKMRINYYKDTLVQLRWNNRTADVDSIIIERRINNSAFTTIAKVSPATSEFIDTNVATGNRYYYYRLRANLKDSIEIQSYPVRIIGATITRGPYTGTPIAIPGTVEAENFDIGKEGIAYHDSDFINLGGVYRLGVGVDIYQIGVFYYVGHMAADEWLEYTINVQQESDYSISATMGAVTAGGQFVLEFQNGTTSPFIAAATGKLSTFKIVANTFHILAGKQIVRLHITQTPDFSINYLKFSVVTSVDKEKIPTDFELFNNYPNPFNPETKISYQMPVTSYISVKVFDILGREVRTLVDGIKKAGMYTIDFNGSELPSGIYFYRLQAGSFTETKKLVLVK